MKTNENWLCTLLREHDDAVTELVKKINSGRGRRTTARKLRAVNRKIFTFITERRPTAQELDACCSPLNTD